MKRLMPILLAAAAAVAAHANEMDSDSSYFHPAASYYIHGDMTSASNLVAQGLAQFPEDGKLLRLKELLEQENEQQSQQDQPQDQQQDQDGESDQEQQQDQQQDPSEDSEQDQDQQDESEQDQQQDAQNQPQAQPPKAEEMSRDEAEQLLDAMRQEEQNKRLQLHPVMGAPVNVEKDW